MQHSTVYKLSLLLPLTLLLGCPDDFSVAGMDESGSESGGDTGDTGDTGDGDGDIGDGDGDTGDGDGDSGDGDGDIGDGDGDGGDGDTGDGDGDTGDGDTGDGDGDTGDGDGDTGDGDGDTGDGDGDTGDGDGDTGDGDGDTGDGDTGDEVVEYECLFDHFVDAPPPTLVDGISAVPIDILDLDAEFDFDLGNSDARADVIMSFQLGAPGSPIFDLRQSHDLLVLDGEPIANNLLARHDFGKGWNAGFAVLDAELDPCVVHTLEISYPLGTPQAPDSGGHFFLLEDPARLYFDLDLSDLEPGRFLESWLPANMPWDHHPIHLGLTLENAGIQHQILSNAEVDEIGDNAWQLEFGPETTAMDPMIAIRTVDQIKSATGNEVLSNGQEIAWEVWVGINTITEPEWFADQMLGWMNSYVQTLGDYAHPHMKLYKVSGNRGMEYAGATMTAWGAARHEVFHTWWARGLEPATYADGWLDEAWTTFAVHNHYSPAPLDWNAGPWELYDPHPFARITLETAYVEGAEVFAGLAQIMGEDSLKAAMADFYALAPVPRSFTTAEIERHLYCAGGEDPQIRQVFHRFVYGLGGEAAPSDPDLCM